MLHKTLYLIATTMLMSACSTQSSGPITPPPNNAGAISKWETSGRVGIRTKNDAVSGNFTWQKDPETFSLNIVGPFGQGAINLKKTQDSLITLAYEDTLTTGHDAGALLQQELGWEFPVEQVTFWIRGLQAPNSPAKITHDGATKQPNKIEQDGWVIQYTNFVNVDGLSLPQKMQVSNPPFKVNLIINQWTIQ
ncbi:lipoprotein insertase outer membrane protein LolB [Marinomonas sp. IMCC 4694]|uniref:lipoprotein insertase outer membrane protein LolB n=1 Tax=Marinomonas sp. IMCC 4694 TaxID=2605432 RepID=UPI0011E76044|nr:lipoprotein insertase outer membrane protein LolB [Marinomonas sp. IMCC 4694]TYL48642.1 outer membrane lipoprotein LolB [Marinomonas sp. IMCC 4694]